MRCPFLKAEEVRYCEISAFRKMISGRTASAQQEICSSRDYPSCSLLKGQDEVPSGHPRCPYLGATVVQYCSAASVTCFIPYSETLLSRCVGERHRYCHLYLSRVHPPGPERSRSARGPEPAFPGPEPGVRSDTIEVPEQLAYATNHMWLDVDSDGGCHVGMDAFFARVAGKVDEVSFLTTGGTARPAAAFVLGGLSLTMTFPNRLHITGFNVDLKANPEALTSDPYGCGWLFEGLAPCPGDAASTDRCDAGLMRCPAAMVWMQAESARMTRFVQEREGAVDPEAGRLMADGGCFCRGIAGLLDRGDLLRLCNAFFFEGATGGVA